jgi:putative oxidoreductase
MFLLSGGSKLAGAAGMVALFDAIGVGQWFRYITGGVEVASAVALLVPALAPFGAVALVATMIGAVATHLFVVGGSPAVPVVLLLGALAVAWARRDQLARAMSRAR